MSAAAHPVTLLEESWPGLSFGRYRENIREGVEWPVQDDRHTLILHLDGRMERLESELEGNGSIRGGAIAGEVWSVPAQRRYLTAAQGGIVTYAVIKINPAAAIKWLGGRVTDVQLSGFLGRYDPYLLQAAIQLSDMLRSSGDLARLGAHHGAQALTAHILAQYQIDGQRTTFRQRRPSELPFPAAKRLAEYIADNLRQTIALSDLADVAGMSEHQLLEGFRLEFGTTPMQYVIDQRLRMAREQLLHSGKSIAEIAVACGFSSHSHLTKHFSARLGMSPSELRRNA